MNKICCKGTGKSGTRCEWDSAWFCKSPDCKSPVLTSTMYGAHPNGCPKICEWNRRIPNDKTSKSAGNRE